MADQHRITADSILAGERRALSKAITCAESSRADDRRSTHALLDALLPHTGKAMRIAISGPPGAGKSTFISALGMQLCGGGQRLAVLSIDPSSPKHGGSILGDKTRMPQLANHANAFVRPSPSGLHSGGVAERSAESLLLCEAAGFEVVLVETVGVGQNEAAASELCDVFVLLLPPAAGDELQGIKRGIVELADLILINKADGDLLASARQAASDYRAALQLLQATRQSPAPVQVDTVSALSGDGIGKSWQMISDCWSALRAHKALGAKRQRQRQRHLHAVLMEALRRQLLQRGDIAAQLQTLQSQVGDNTLSVGSAVDQILTALQLPHDQTP